MQHLSTKLEKHHLIGFERDLKPVVVTRDNYMGALSLEDGLDCLIRRRFFHEEAVQLKQVFANFWLLLRFHDYAPGMFRARFETGCISPSGSFYVYVPPCSFSDWFLGKGVHEYEMYLSFRPPEPFFPYTPTVFPYDQVKDIKGYDDIVGILAGCRFDDHYSGRAQSYVVGRTKKFLDQYFAEDLSFDEIASTLKIPYSTMAAAFKNHYGIPAVKYRNNLRTFEALRLIRFGKNVTESCLEAGFTSATQYNEHFHTHLGAPPSMFTKLRRAS